MKLILVAIVLLSLSLPDALGLECYSCSTLGDDKNQDGCNDKMTNTRTKTCKEDEVSCNVYAYKKGDIVHTKRSCIPKTTTCTTLEESVKLAYGKDFTCEICEKDLCNRSSSLGASLATLLTVGILYQIFRF